MLCVSGGKEVESNMDTERTLNRLLVQFFKYIMEIEERKLITDEFREITYNDMHIIEAIGLDQPKKMSEKRVVNMMLTKRGELAYRHHERFHQDMIAFILEHVSEEESQVLRRSLERLMGYFQQKYDPM